MRPGDLFARKPPIVARTPRVSTAFRRITLGIYSTKPAKNATLLRMILISSDNWAMDLPAPSTRTLLAGFDQNYNEVVRFLARRTGNMDEARGLAHDTWLRIAERKPHAEADIQLADPRAYLFTVAHNLAMNHLRRGNWLQGYMHEREQMEVHTPCQTPDVADGAMYRQALAAVETVLHALPERARDVFLAHRLHGESQADIADRLRVSLNTVERDMTLATQRIETALHTWRGTPQTTHAAEAPRTTSKSRRKSLAALLGVFTVGATGTALWQNLQREAMRWQTALATPRGRTLQQPLPDGSHITLDAHSKLDVAYSADSRAVQLLKGAAFFAVQRDPARPLTVQALETQVTVLGTRFGVEIENSDTVLVQVESGHVKVWDGSRSHDLLAGQGLRIRQGRATPATADTAALWRKGELAFDALPLADAVARVARYAPFELRTAPSARGLQVSGTLRIADARDWLTALPRVLPVQLVKLPGGGIEVAAR